MTGLVALNDFSDLAECTVLHGALSGLMASRGGPGVDGPGGHTQPESLELLLDLLKQNDNEVRNRDL